MNLTKNYRQMGLFLFLCSLMAFQSYGQAGTTPLTATKIVEEAPDPGDGRTGPPPFTMAVSEQEKLDIKLYPNPNNGTFTINSTLPMQGKEVVILNMLGSTVHRELISSLADEITIRTENLAKGIYILAIGNTSKKFQVK